jgi:hypothetical protein
MTDGSGAIRARNVATNSLADATYFQNDSGAASRYLTVRNDGGSAFTYLSERLDSESIRGRAPGPLTSSAVLVSLGVDSLFTERSC